MFLPRGALQGNSHRHPARARHLGDFSRFEPVPQIAPNRGLLAPLRFAQRPVLPLAAWYLYHWHRTGFVFGNPEYLRYNATTTLTPLRVLLALGTAPCRSPCT